jgi:tRNA threonylcarbamoyladenosine biosynthesis protein TsaB
MVLETSGRVGQVALALGEQLLSERRLDEARRHARDLAPSVAALLAEQGWRPADLELVIVSLGPGSYTGLRVGLMSARALAYALGKPLLGVETFQAIARQAPPEARAIEVIADAQQDKVYTQSFRRDTDGAAPHPTSGLTIQSFAAWVAGRDPDAWVTGPGLTLYGPRLSSEVRLVEAEAQAPRVASVLAVGMQRWGQGEQDDLWSLEPIYGRPSSAEEKWNARGTDGGPTTATGK